MSGIYRLLLVAILIMGMTGLVVWLTGRVSPDALQEEVAHSTPTNLNHRARPFGKPKPVREVLEGPAAQTNLLARILGGEALPRLAIDLIEPHLTTRRRDAESLIGALAATGDIKYLHEAISRHPDDPVVGYLRLVHPELAEELTPEHQRSLLQRFAESAPDNSLPLYLLAAEHLRSGEQAAALDVLNRLSGSGQFRDYSEEILHATEDAWRAGGRPEADAKTIALMNQPISWFPQVREAVGLLVDWNIAATASGDSDMALQIQNATLLLGSQLQAGRFSGTTVELVGLATQEKITANLPAGDLVDASSGLTAKQLLEALAARKAFVTEELAELGQIRSRIAPGLSDAELIALADRAKTFGEPNAWKWLIESRRDNDSGPTPKE